MKQKMQTSLKLMERKMFRLLRMFDLMMVYVEVFTFEPEEAAKRKKLHVTMLASDSVIILHP